jgi:hypothetical protein
MVWFFQYLKYLPDPEPYRDPKTAPAKWKKKQSIDWLQAHGLMSTGSAKELKEIIKQYYDTDTVPDIIPVQGCSVADILRVITSLQQLIANCMKLSGHPDEKYLIGSCVRVFLTNYTVSEESIYTGTILQSTCLAITSCHC